MPLAPLEKVLFLKEVPLFGQLPPDEIAAVAPIAHEVEFTAGDVMIRQGDVGDRLFVVVEGRVQVEIDGRVLDEPMTEKDVIGELAILSGDRRKATCTALSEVVALEIRRDDFWKLLRAHPEVAIGVIEILLKYVKS